MTQLNLSGRQSNNTQQKPITEQKDESIKNQTVGALGALAMFAAVIVIGSCSHSSSPVAAQQPVQPAAPVSAPVAAPPAPAAPANVPVAAKAKAKRQRAAILSYTNPEYGFSFDFPRSYPLKTATKTTGIETQPPSVMADLPQMNFARPGGVTLAEVAMPGNSYPGTDFKSGFVKVSVNPGMTSEECTQFAVPDPEQGTNAVPQAKVGQVKLGATEFHKVEISSAAMMKQADSKYYHVFSNGTCYEFALGVGTAGAGATDLKPVDRTVVFGKLEKILATAKFRPTLLPETARKETQTLQPEAPVPASAATSPADPSKNPAERNAAEHEATKPNF